MPGGLSPLDLLPAGHGVHSVAPLIGEKKPPLHVRHVLEVFTPDAEENVPARHKVHAEAPPKE